MSSPLLHAGAPRVGAAIYTRTALSAAVEHAAQRAVCVPFIAAQPDWALLASLYADDGYSGATLQRPALRRLRGDVAAGAIDIVVVRSYDRLARSCTAMTRLIAQFAARDVRVVSVMDGVDSPGPLMRSRVLSRWFQAASRAGVP